MSDSIIVSIRCTVFNHGPYLRQCLDGFVSQKTTFKFEAFVHDDASTDDSAVIITEYARKYPEIIKPYLEDENLYSKRDGRFISATYNPTYLKGKYIALCEGDDYWTDPFKLQKQVDYMESHPECSMCFGNAIEHWESSNQPDKEFSHISDRDYLPGELTQGWFISTASVLFRRPILESDLFHRYTSNKRIITGDLPLWLTCASMGTVHGFSDCFCVYRRLPSGFMLGMDASKRIAMGDHRIEIYKVFGPLYRKSTISMAMTHYRLAFSYAKKERNLKVLFKSIWKSVFTRLLYPDVTIYHLKAILKERKARLSKYKN